jgi:hypothetical protein
MNTQGDRALNDEMSVLEPSLQRLRIFGTKWKLQSNLELVSATIKPFTRQEAERTLIMGAPSCGANQMDTMEREVGKVEPDKLEDEEADCKATKSDDSEVKV